MGLSLRRRYFSQLCSGKSFFRMWEGVVGTGWSWLRIGTGGGHL